MFPLGSFLDLDSESQLKSRPLRQLARLFIQFSGWRGVGKALSSANDLTDAWLAGQFIRIVHYPGLLLGWEPGIRQIRETAAVATACLEEHLILRVLLDQYIGWPVLAEQGCNCRITEKGGWKGPQRSHLAHPPA